MKSLALSSPAMMSMVALSFPFTAANYVSTEKTFDYIAKFATADRGATYESTTKINFRDLFSCTTGDDFDLEDSQDAAWAGFVDYAEKRVNAVLLVGATGRTVEAVDEWGARCSDPNLGSCGERYSECADEATCQPKLLEYPLEDGVLVIEIFEPCNFVSNLAYYRVMPQLCGEHFNMDEGTSTALVRAFAALGFGSAFWHGSHTYTGAQTDVKLIEIVAFLNHQLIVSSLADGYTDVAYIEDLVHLQDTPRAKTAIEISEEVTNILPNFHSSEWAHRITPLDLPSYELTFSIIIGSVFSLIFPDREDTVTEILDALGSLLGVEAEEYSSYLPALRRLVANLNISDEERFVLFRQLMGMGCKMIFAFLWQEQIIRNPYFLEEEPNRIAAEITAPLFSMFNFISGHKHSDASFQRFEGMYPGDEICRATEPHAKWHEMSANALLDMVYLADCSAAIASGTAGTGCAELSSLDGLGEITRSDLETFLANELGVADFPIVKDVLPQFISRFFFAFDSNDDDKIDMKDIEYYVDTIEGWPQEIQKFIGSFEDILSLFDTVNCVTDSQCPTGEKCIFLSCGKQEDGDPCLAPSDCESNVCSFFTCGLQSKGEPCLLGNDCESGRCDWESFTCATTSKLPDGSPCYTFSDCETNRCISFACGLKDDGNFCSADSQCKSGNCRWTWSGGPQCT